MSWVQSTLGEVADIFSGYAFKSADMNSEGGTPLIKIKNIADSAVSHECDAFLNKDFNLAKFERFHLLRDDFLVAMTGQGSVGRIGKMRDYKPGFYVNQRVAIVRVNPEKANPVFIFYQIATRSNELELFKKANGAGQPNISAKQIGELPVVLPSTEQQQYIADVLSSYDDLIENNQKQIKLLEEAAQRLYKEWFVDLRFPSHETTPIVDGVPEGWTYKPFSEVFDYVRGKSYTSKELSDTTGILMANLKNIRAFGGYNRNAEKRFTGQYKANQMLYAGDIVMGVTDMTQERRLVGHVALVPDLGEKMIFSMDLIKIIPKLTDNLFLYSAMYYGGLSKQISPLANGVNVLHLKPEAMMGIEMLTPTKDILERYHQQFAPMVTRIEALQKQCDVAAEARDRLIPKLMNREIEV